MTFDCRNCNHHWSSEKYPETCPKCNSFAVMSTDEWSEEDALEEAKFPNG